MADNDPSIYDTREQLDFARAMAKTLLGQGNYVPDAAMAKLPGTWMYGVPNIIKAISGAQYRDVAGDRESELVSRQSGQPRVPAQRYGQWAKQPPSLADNNDPGTYSPKVFNPSAEYGSSDDFLRRVAMIESGGDPNARTGSYRGRYQFGKAEESRYGLNDSNWNNPKEQERAIREHMTWLHPQLEKSLGRAPTPGELYLAHQQGVAGAPALINNPDEPAWKAIRPYYRSDEMAKLAVRGNIPKGSPLSKIPVEDVKARDFSRMWTSRFDDMNIDNSPSLANSIPPPIQAQETSPVPKPPMGLGGPPVTPEPTPKAPTSPLAPGNPTLGVGVSNPALEGENQPTAQNLGGPQLAQAGGPNAPTITTNPQVSPTIQAPGYGVPPPTPLPSREQLDAILRTAPAEQRAKIMEDYLNRRSGEDIETPFGKRRITPGANPGDQPIVTDMPNKTFPLSLGGLGLTMVPGPNGQMILMTPDGKGINSVEELTEWKRRQEAMDTASQKITEGQSNEITEAISAGNKAPQLIKSLNTLDSLSKSSDVPRGPLSKYSVAVRQVIDNLGLTKYLPNIAEADLSKAETIQKINAELARQAVQTFTNRGTNFELETYIQNNPGILQSKQGMEMLIDIIRQEYKGIQEIGRIANNTRPGDVASFNAKIAEYYEKNPIIITGPIRDPKTNKIIDKAGKLTTRTIQNREDIEKIPSGQYFMMPDGRIGKKP